MKAWLTTTHKANASSSNDDDDMAMMTTDGGETLPVRLVKDKQALVGVVVVLVVVARM